MKTLNLVDIDKSDIKYIPTKFPDGQQNITILDSLKTCEDGDIIIKSRLNNFSDLELLACTVASIRQLFFGKKGIRLYVPYFLGSRSDRKFENGGNNYLKDVICPIINSLNFESVTVLDPHSDVLEACLNRFKKIDNSELIKFAFNQIGDNDSRNIDNHTVILSPDAGARKKIYKLAEQIEYKGDIITCSKDRDEDGKLTKCVVPWEEHYFGKDLIIIDDICDGGATFINISKELKELTKDFNPPKIYLIVTHGIFSKGFGELQQYFDAIYTTNSYKQLEMEPFVKQLDVF